MKKYFLNLVFISLFFSVINTYAAEVSCNGFNSGGRSCDMCFEDRFYINTNFSVWDWYYNRNPGLPEIVFSNSRSNVQVETMGNLTLNNGVATNLSLISGFSPAGKNRVLVFNPRGLRFTSSPATRNTIASRVIYTLGSSNGGIQSIESNNWNYTDGTESNIGGVLNLSTWVVFSSGRKYFDLPPQTMHTECHNLYTAWCGDGVRDASESCDFNDASHSGWGVGGCNASCQPVSGPGGGGSSCGDGIRNAGESCDFNDASHSGWGVLGCSNLCLPLNPGGGGGGFCGNGILEVGEQCDDGNNISGDGCSATCTTEGGSSGPGGGITTNPGINSYCGDGIIERPNASGQYEQCDTTESWCQNCQFTNTNPGVGSPGRITITNPGVSSPISISSYKIIVGDGVNIFSRDDTIKFDGGGNNIYLGGLPVKMVNNADTILTGNDIQYTLPSIGVGTVFFKDHDVYDGSGNLIDIVYNRINFPNSITLFNGSSLFGYGYKGKPINTIYSDTRTPAIPSLSPANTFFVSIGYLEENLPIRISKSAVSNTSGGNAYLFKPAGYDLGFINNSNFIENLKKGNFTVTSINDTANLVRLSSLTTNIVDENIQDKIKTSASGSKESIDSLSQKPFVSAFSNNIFSISDFDSLDKLGDNENIRISNQTVIINGMLNLTGKKTIVIENGDLVINKDIKYIGNTSSWAFIVKNGNIIISKNVSQISGVFMSLNGEIKSDGDKISKQLIVDGSLYGDSGDLVKNRTYIRATTGYSAITTGVIINYSSRILKNPPPLLLNYINQFNLDRVAK